jgi:type IV secretion system protein TrbL
MWGIMQVQALVGPTTDPIAPVWEQFANAQAVWFPVLFDYAQKVFLSLALVEIGLGALLWMTQGRDAEQISGGLFRKIIWIGFMYAVLLNAQRWIPAVIDSFVIAGSTASGVPALNPGEVVLQGIGIAFKIFATVGRWGLLTSPVGFAVTLVAAFCILFAFLLIAMQLLFTLIESYIVTGAGVFLLGFAAFRGTATISERYLGYVVAVGIKLFVLYLIVGAGMTLADQWGQAITPETMASFAGPLSIMCAALCYGAIAWHIPSVAASAISGAVGFGTSEMLTTAFMAQRLLPNMGGLSKLGSMPGGATDPPSGGRSGPIRAGAAVMGATMLGSAPRGMGPSGGAPQHGMGGSVPKLGGPSGSSVPLLPGPTE